MLNSWLIAKPEMLSSWQPKIDLTVVSCAYSDDCQILANNDLEATYVWVNQYKHTPTTFRVYQKEVERLLLWCVFEKGLTLGELKVLHFEEYFDFLQDPPIK